MIQREKAVDSNAVTRAYFDEILVEMRHIDAVEPDTALELYGETFATPVMTAALSHLKGKDGEGDGMVQMAEGARQAGAVNWAGMGDEAQFDAVAATGARSIKIIKPYADERLVLSRLERAEEAGALAVGMDLDHSFGGDGKPDLCRLRRDERHGRVQGPGSRCDSGVGGPSCDERRSGKRAAGRGGRHPRRNAGTGRSDGPHSLARYSSYRSQRTLAQERKPFVKNAYRSPEREN